MADPILTYGRLERNGGDGLILQDFDPRFTHSELSWRSRGTDEQREAMNAETEDGTDEPLRAERGEGRRSVASAQADGRTTEDQVSQRSARRRTVSREVETVVASRDVSGRTRVRVETTASVTVQETYDGAGIRSGAAQVSQRSRSMSPDSDSIGESQYSRRSWPPATREVTTTHSPEAVSEALMPSRERPVDAAIQDENARPRAAEPAHRNREGQTTLSGRSVRESVPRPRRQSDHGDSGEIDGGALVRTPRTRANQPSRYVPESDIETHGEGWRVHTVSSYLAVLNAMRPNLPQTPASRVPRPQQIDMYRDPVAGTFQLPQLPAEATGGFADDSEIQWHSPADRLSLTQTYGRASAGGSWEDTSPSNVQEILRHQRARQRTLEREAALRPTGERQTRNGCAYTSGKGNLEEAYKQAYRRLDQSFYVGTNRLEMQAKLQSAIDKMNLEEDMKRLGLW